MSKARQHIEEYAKFRSKQQQVFDSRNNWVNSVQPDKYGKKQDYNENCMKSVEKVVKILGTDTSTTNYASLIEKILKDLAQDRHNIALEAAKNKDAESENLGYFGKWREKDCETHDFTATDGQHDSIRKPLLEKIIYPHLDRVRKKYPKDTNSDMSGNFVRDNSGYKVTEYFQTGYDAINSKGEKKRYTKEEFFKPDILDKYKKIDFNGVTPVYGNCSDLTYELFAYAKAKSTHAPAYTTLIEGQILYQTEKKEWIPLTTHVTWFNESELEMFKESIVALGHTDPKNFDQITNELGRHLKNVIEWKKENGEDKLNASVATIHYLLAHMMPTHRGSATIAKIFTKSLYYYHGFELVPAKVDTEEDLEALKQPYLTVYIKNYTGLFVSSPTAKPMPEEMLQHIKSSTIDENVTSSSASSSSPAESSTTISAESHSNTWQKSLQQSNSSVQRR